MPVADLPYTDELTAFRRRIQNIIDGRFDLLDEDEDTTLCSDEEAPVSRSVAMTRQLAPPLRQGEQCRTTLLLKEAPRGPNGGFVPSVPKSLRELGVRDMDVEAIILKFLLNSGPHIGFEIAKHIRAPHSLIGGLLRQLKEEQLVVYKSSAAAGDFLYELTEVGIQRARRYWEHCTYFGAYLFP